MKQFFNDRRICKSMVFGVKGAPVGVKYTIINMIISSWMAFPIVDMTVRFRWKISSLI